MSSEDRADETSLPVDRIDGPTTMPSDRTGWWETERAEFIRQRIAQASPPGARMVDVGGGRGDMLQDPRFADNPRVCVDSHIWREWNRSNGIDFVCAAAEALPFRDGSFDLVGSFDVLEHIPDDRGALQEQLRLLTPGGHIVGAVPADPRLWSQHDEDVGHVRRYDAGSLGDLARESGLSLATRTHFYSFLWAPARLMRHSSKRTSEPGRSPSILGRSVRATIGLLARAERAVGRRVAIPFGTSIYFEMNPPDGRDLSQPRKNSN